MTTTQTDVRTVADVIRFVLDHRAVRVIPEGWRSDVEPVRPESFREAKPRRLLDYSSPAEYHEALAAYGRAKNQYDAAYATWQDWHTAGGWFRPSSGSSLHRHLDKVEPGDLYPITMRLLGVSESKAKALTRAAFEAGEIVRQGSGSAVSYTLPEIVEAREQGYVDRDIELRALVARAEAVGLAVQPRYRQRNYHEDNRRQVVGVDLVTPIERVIEMLEERA